MSDSEDQEERDNLAAREIALAEQHEDPPDPNAAHNRANDGARHNEEVMGDFDSNPTLLIDRNPIQPPLPEGRSYEISPEIIGLVKQNQFQGKPQENPLEHIDAFEEICGTISAGGAPKEYLKCKLFSFTLTGKALRWVKSLPAQSITTWKEYKVAFLGHFFTKQRANLLREKISSFQQGPVEPFHEALERFKDYTRECPNHGLSEGSLWNIFYRGISGKCRFSLDTASNGNFMTKTVTEAKILIENLASSDSDNFIGHERAVKAINSDPYRDGYSEIKAMMAEILRNQGREVERQREAYRVESTIIQDYFGDLIPSFQEEVNFVGIDGSAHREEAWKGEHDVFTQESPNEKRDVHGGRNYQQPPHKRRMEPRSNFEDLITFIKSSHREHTALIDERLESAFTD
ncbi:unnamed protein product [Microthlaspi erraticum]|uniref:Retrotransposon gag domain-containing protein n=1 Tax=Microthlaspi erraticum TaxID=1685480 RepID=A0A6D2JRT9_9BRAS|nr:unnamed protein product [Microthlaspi erraticum]